MRIRDEQKEQNLRRKAIEMIATEGLERFGINKLAKAATVSPGTIYIYFKDKEDLIVQLTIAVGSHVLEYSLKGVKPDMSFEAALRKQWANRIRHCRQFPEEVQFIEQVRYSPLYHKVRDVLTEKYGDLMGSIVHGAIARKELAPLPFDVYWSLAFGPLYQLIRFNSVVQNDGRQRFTLNPAKFEDALNIVLKGLKPS